MKKIKKLACLIDEELEGAQRYAECYVERKASDDSSWALKFKQMANDELNHAMYIHQLVVEEIEKLSKVFQVPTSMQEKWNDTHKKYVERAAWIKQMLSL